MSVAVVKADVKFLRRVLLTLVCLALATGVVAGVTTVHAMNAQLTENSAQ